MEKSKTPNFVDFGWFPDMISKSFFNLLKNRTVFFEKKTILKQK